MKLKCSSILDNELTKLIRTQSNAKRRITLSMDVGQGGIGDATLTVENFNSLDKSVFNNEMAGKEFTVSIRPTEILELIQDYVERNDSEESAPLVARRVEREPVVSKRDERHDDLYRELVADEYEDEAVTEGSTEGGIEDYPVDMPIGNIFSGQEQKVRPKKTGERTPIDRLAAIEPPENRQERRSAIKPPKENGTPPQFKETENPKFRKFIKDAEDFYESVLKSKNKKSSVDIEGITNPRLRAVAEEQKAIDESIGVPSYIVNEKYASLQINDLHFALPKDSPIDLSRFSAKRLYDSNDLKQVIENKMVRFVSPEEAKNIIQRAAAGDEEDIPDTFSSHKEARSAIIDRDADDDDTESLNLENDLDGPTEQERMANLLTDLTPRSVPTGSRRTSHGSVPAERPKTDKKVTHQQHKAIKRSY